MTAAALQLLKDWQDAGRDLSSLSVVDRRRFRVLSFLGAVLIALCMVLAIWTALLDAWWFMPGVIGMAVGVITTRLAQRLAPTAWAVEAGAFILCATICATVAVMLNVDGALNSAGAVWLGGSVIIVWAVLKPIAARIVTAVMVAACVLPAVVFFPESLVAAPKPTWDVAGDIIIGSLVLVAFIELMVVGQRQAEGELQHTVSQLEDEISRREEAEGEAMEAGRLKASFLATMSHEIRTPLNGVLGMVNMLAETDLNEEQREMLEVLRSSGDLLSRVLNDTLDVSRLQAGGMALRLGPTPVRATLQQAVALMDGSTQNLPIRLHIDEAVPDYVRTDGDRVQQMVCNLLNNALRFTDEGHVEVRVSPQASGIRVEVADTGTGIPPSEQARIFQAFTQVDDGHDRRHGGTGLGLAIVRGLAEAMGGETGLSSTVGQGTVVWFEIHAPACEAPAPKAAPAPVPVPSLVPRRVLLAEDNAINARILEHILTRMGLETTWVENGRLAVDALQDQGFDLVLMDCQMPELDGYAATRLLRAAGSTVPIIGCTANAMPEDKERCLGSGMDGYVTKPVNEASLREAIEEAMQARTAPLRKVAP